MLATVAYIYDYSSYLVWVGGSLAVGVLLSLAFPRMPKFAASFHGFLMSSAGAYLWGRIGLDSFVTNELRISMRLPPLSFEAWDSCHSWAMSGFLNLLPAYYTYRFLTTRGRDSLRFAVVPLLVAFLFAFQNRLYDGNLSGYRIQLPLVQLVIFVLFTLRGLSADAPNQPDRGQPRPALDLGSPS